MRIDPHQKWHPVYLPQPFYNVLLMAFFEWGVAFHDLDFDAIRTGEKSKEQVARGAEGDRRQGAAPDRQGLHRLPGAAAAKVAGSATLATANLTANFVRNVWSNAIIFCGHFPDQTYTFTEEEVEDETQRRLVRAPAARRGQHRGQRRSSTCISGNLGYQVEHHLFPDMPSTRYGEIAPRVREICERYGLPYNTGPFRKQSAWCSGRSCGWRSPAASRARSPARTAGTSRRPR